MRMFLAVTATIVLVVYVGGLALHGMSRARSNRRINQRFNPQWTPGKVRGPGVGLTFWFLIGLSLTVLYLIWFKK